MGFNVALLQIAPRVGPTGNLAKGIDFCRRARDLGADLVVFPELWSLGAGLPATPEEQPHWNAAAIDRRSDFFRSFGELARELRINIAITYLEAAVPKPRNSVSILDAQGKVALHYSKVFICDFPADAHNACGCDINCSPGTSFPVAVLQGGEDEVRIGAMICADREFPEPATQLMLNGAELIVVPNACHWDDVRSAGLLTRAMDNLVGVAMANYPRPRANGNSCAYTCVAWQDHKPADSLIVRAGEDEELVLARFDLEALRDFRRAESWRLDYRRRAARP